MTFMELAFKTLSAHKAPLSAEEIWEKSEEYGIRKDFKTSGKTPARTIGAQLYVDIKENPKTPFYQYSKRPTRFFLKETTIALRTIPEKTAQESAASFHERELHPLLVSFIYADAHFRCVAKTIFHEKSKKSNKGKNEWLHPDIVGIYFPKLLFDTSTYNLMQVMDDCQYRLYSFEMKKRVDFSNLREYFFQAVSNSSWANEGYLVALDFADNLELQEEMRRLNNAFGIGFIKLNTENVEQSEIMFSARYNENVDWDTIDRLSETNQDFKEFVTSAVSDIRGTGEPYPGKYDRVLTGEQIEKYIKEHGIK